MQLTKNLGNQVDINTIMPTWLQAIGARVVERSAGHFEASCPFHISRSLKIDGKFRDRGWYIKCHSCGIKGGIWDLAREYYKDEALDAKQLRERILAECHECDLREIATVSQSYLQKNVAPDKNRLTHPKADANKVSGANVTSNNIQTVIDVGSNFPPRPQPKLDIDDNDFVNRGEYERGVTLQPQPQTDNERDAKFLEDIRRIFGTDTAEEPQDAPSCGWEASNQYSHWFRERAREMAFNVDYDWKTAGEPNWRFKTEVIPLASPEKGCRNIAKIRGISYEGVRLAHDWGYVRFSMFRRRACWMLVGDAGNMIEFRQMDGTPFGDTEWQAEAKRAAGIEPEEAHKALCLPGSTKSRCLLGSEQLPLHFGPLRLVEGGPDFLAACSLFWEELDQPGINPHLPLAVLTESWIPRKVHAMQFAGRDVQIIGHNDPSGEKQLQKNANILTECGARVTMVRIKDIWPDAKHKADLNDLMRDRPDLIKKLYRTYS